jgi:endoglucanase
LREYLGLRVVYDKPDAEWFSSIGLNLIRLAINYRHLNDDMNPSVIKQEGFLLIDRVIDIVS